jgi:hypothetical protein
MAGDVTNPLGVSHCENCKAPTENAICWRCTQTLQGMLHDLKPLIGELDIQVMKQNVEPRQPGSAGKKTEYPILFNIQASALMDRVLETLAGLLSRIEAGVLLPLRSLSRVGKVRAYLNHLERNVIPLSRVEGAYADIEDLKVKIVRAIDRQPRRKALGVCATCGQGLFATDDQDEIECCGAVLDTAEERTKLNTLARNHWVTANQAIALGESEGVQFNASTIRSWVRRGKLTPQTPKHAGQEQQFLFGELLDLVRAED